MHFHENLIVLIHLIYLFLFKDGKRIWMYKAKKTELYFRGELYKFIKVAEYKK